MIRGLYTATSGMLVQQAMHEVISNNIANVNTTGFKRDVAVFRDFPEMYMSRIDDYKEKLNQLKIDHRPSIGSIGTGAVVEEVATIAEQGPVTTTGNNLDFALSGDGYFALYTNDGIKYTRDGTFSLNSDGVLVNRDGYPVLVSRNQKTGQEPVVIDEKNEGVLAMSTLNTRETDYEVNVDKSGQIYVDQDPRYRFCVVKFENPQFLRKEGNNLYVHEDERAGKGTLADKTEVLQGQIEGSNINIMHEMVNMIAAFRAYESCQKTVSAMDSTLDKAVNTLPRIT